MMDTTDSMYTHSHNRHYTQGIGIYTYRFTSSDTVFDVTLKDDSIRFGEPERLIRWFQCVSRFQKWREDWVVDRASVVLCVVCCVCVSQLFGLHPHQSWLQTGRSRRMAHEKRGRRTQQSSAREFRSNRSKRKRKERESTSLSVPRSSFPGNHYRQCVVTRWLPSTSTDGSTSPFSLSHKLRHNSLTGPHILQRNAAGREEKEWKGNQSESNDFFSKECKESLESSELWIFRWVTPSRPEETFWFLSFFRWKGKCVVKRGKEKTRHMDRR